MLHHVVDQSQACSAFLFEQSSHRLELHLHTKGASLAQTWTLHINFAACRLNYLFHNVQTQSEPLTVDLSCALKLAKAREKLVHVF